MIRHIVLLQFDDEMEPAAIDAIATRLNTLPAAIPELRSYSVGPDLGLAEGNADLGVVGDFDDIDGYLAYRDAPAHRAVIEELVLPRLVSRSAVQVEVP